jgi:DNA polymerase III subunit beta
MEFQVDKTILLNALNIVSKAISLKPNNDIMGDVLIELKDHKVRLVGSNYDCTIISMIEVLGINNGKIALPARKLIDIISKLNDVISVKVDDMVTIKSGKSKFVIPHHNANLYPEFSPAKISNGCTVNRSEVIKGIKQALPSVTAGHATLGGVLFNTESNLTIAGVSMSKISETICLINKTTDIFTNQNAIVPSDMAQNVQKILTNSTEEEVRIGINPTQMICRQTNIIIIMNLLSGIFPDYSKLISMDFKKSCSINRNDLLMALERVNIISSQNTSNILKMIFTKNKLKIESIHTQNGLCEDEMEIDYEHQDNTISVVYTNIHKLISALSGETIKMHFSNSAFNIKITSEDDNFVGLFAPSLIQ